MLYITGWRSKVLQIHNITRKISIISWIILSERILVKHLPSNLILPIYFDWNNFPILQKDHQILKNVDTSCFAAICAVVFIDTNQCTLCWFQFNSQCLYTWNFKWFSWNKFLPCNGAHTRDNIEIVFVKKTDDPKLHWVNYWAKQSV